jgi:hypothetical protein
MQSGIDRYLSSTQEPSGVAGLAKQDRDIIKMGTTLEEDEGRKKVERGNNGVR